MNSKIKTLFLLLPLVMTGCGSSGGKTSESSKTSEASASQQTSSQEQSSEQVSSQQQSSEQASSQEQSSEEQQSSEAQSQSQQQSSEQASSQSEETSGDTSSHEIDPSVKSVKVKFWHTFGQTVQDALKPKIKAFHDLVLEHDGVDVEVEMTYQGSYDDIASKIISGFATDNIPTISVAYPDNVADYLQKAKENDTDYVANLDEFIDDEKLGFGLEDWLGDKDDETDFVYDFFREGKNYIFDGTYSLPFMKSTEIMFYNYDMVEKAMEYYDPSLNSESKIKRFMKNLTWDDFMDLCEAIGEHKADIGNMLEVPAYYDSDSNFFITKMFQNEIPFSSISERGNGVIDFKDGQTRQDTLDLLSDLRAVGPTGKNLVTTKGIVGKYGSDYFTNEKVAFSIGSSGGAGYNFPEQDAFTLGVCRVPHSNDNPMYVSQGPTLCMFNDNKVTDSLNYTIKAYAWRFLKYITNPVVNAELCINGSEGYIPVRNSAYETAIFQEFMEEGERYAQCYKVVLDDINYDAEYLVTPAFKGSAELRDQVGILITATFNATDDDQLDGLLQAAIDNAQLKM